VVVTSRKEPKSKLKKGYVSFHYTGSVADYSSLYIVKKREERLVCSAVSMFLAISSRYINHDHVAE